MMDEVKKKKSNPHNNWSVCVFIEFTDKFSCQQRKVRWYKYTCWGNSPIRKWSERKGQEETKRYKWQVNDSLKTK